MSGVGLDSTAREADGFRPDLEGLRAVAVGLVVLFHAQIPPFTGGYVGVDVFFVLSGFLITGLLVRELEGNGRISLPAFYARRARRLLPAAAFVLVVTAIASAVMLPPLRLPDVSFDIASAAGYVSNLRFALQATNYLQSDLPPSPVLHFWSLGVEEQFYLFWPALLAIVTGAAYAARDRARGARRVTTTLAVILVASLGLSVWLTGVQQPWAFFSLPARSWELALGGLLAMPVATRLAGARLGAVRLAPALAWIGLGLVAVSGVVLTEATPFPGTAALLPTIGTAFVIFGGLGAPGAIPGRTAAPLVEGPRRLLSVPPLRYVGRISYSLYLWHWPVLVLPAAAFGPLAWPVRVALVGLAVVLSAGSQRWIEEPFRRGRLTGTAPRRVLALAGALTVAVAASALGVGAWSLGALRPHGTAAGGGTENLDIGPVATARLGEPRSSPGAAFSVPASLPPLAPAPVPADLVPALLDARNDLPVIYNDGCHADPSTTELPQGCAFGDLASPTNVVLFGDSHAAQWFPAFERLAKEQHWRLVSLTKSACASADVDVWIDLDNRSYTECATWRERAFELIAKLHPALVVIANERGASLAIDGAMAVTQDHEDVWAAGLDRTLRRLMVAGTKVVVIGDTVRQATDPLDCLSSHLGDASACSTPFDQAVDVPHDLSEWHVAMADGATFIDPTPWMCATDRCPSVIGRFLVFRDTHHMTATFSRALAPLLFAVLPAIP